jgi:hypothetical protein
VQVCKHAHALPVQELALPSDLEADVRALLGIYAALEAASGAELAWLAREVLYAQCHSPLPPKQARLAASSCGGLQQEERVITYVAEWYVQRILRGGGDVGVSPGCERLPI